MIAHQLSSAWRDVVSLRFRAVLLVMQVLVTSLCLGFTLNDSIRSAGNIAVADSLSSSEVTYFSLYYNDAVQPNSNEDLDRLLTTTLDGSHADYSVIKNNYFHNGAVSSPVVVALGGFARAYGLESLSSGRDAVLVGANVTQYSVGDTVDFGPNQATVTTRLSAGQAYLDPWMGYESLDDSVVLLSTYERFAQSNPPDAWQQEVVGRTVLLDRGAPFVDNYVLNVAATGGMDVIPQPLQQRVSTIYDAQLGKSFMFLLFFASLLVVMLMTVVSSLNALMKSNIRRYAIERLYGANQGHLVLRMQLFLAMVFALPTFLVFSGLAVLAPSLQSLVPVVLILVLLGQLILPLHAIRILRSMSIAPLLRKE